MPSLHNQYNKIYTVSAFALDEFYPTPKERETAMKNLRKAELAALALTALCLFFTAGYFTGRSAGAHIIIAEPAAPKTADSQALSADSQSSDKLAASDTNTADISAAATADAGGSDSPADLKPAPPSDKLNINTASAAALESLPGIGRVLARRIVEYREKIGGCKTIAQLKEVNGSGDKKFEALKELVTVQAA
jgi:competence ComEA-like helix-hairpin-helix protein